jgi:hypothetical protein
MGEKLGFMGSLCSQLSFLYFCWHQEYIEVPHEKLDIIEELFGINKLDKIKKLEIYLGRF